MPKTAPDARLRAAAAYVRQDACFADIGTDHAYLPVFLLQTGKISHAIATDIARGPLDRARATAEEAGLLDRVSLRLTSGLCGLENDGITDASICGMGGELIASLLEASPFVRTPDLRLILQPMTRAAHLRRYLAKEGFIVEDETLCRAGGRLYACLCVHYGGTPYTLSPLEALLGVPELTRGEQDPLFLPYVKSHVQTLTRAVTGRQMGGQDPHEDLTLLHELEALL